MKWTVIVSSNPRTQTRFKSCSGLNHFEQKNWFFGVGDGDGSWHCLCHYSFSLLLRIDVAIIWKFMLWNSNVSHHRRPYVRMCASLFSVARLPCVCRPFCILWKWRIVNAKPKPNKCQIGNVFSTDIYSSVRIGDGGIHATLVRARIANDAPLSPGQWQSSEKYQIEKFFLHS